MSTLLCLVRHGESEWNLEKRIQGQSDPALTMLGGRQAEAVAERLAGDPWDLLYSSDLARARETAERIARRIRLEIRFREALRERYQGKLEGMLAVDARKAYPDFDAPEVGRETIAQLRARAVEAISGILDEGRNKRLIVVCHGGVIRAYLHHLEDLGAPVKPVETLNTSITLIRWLEDSPEILAVNDATHLAANGLMRPA